MANYIVRIYKNNHMIRHFTIEDRTEREADKEAEAEYKRTTGADDYTLEEINK